MSSNTFFKEEALPFETGCLHQIAIKRCEEELNETPDRKIKGIQELQSLLQNNSETAGIDFQEDFLVSYLRRNKYRIKDARQQIEKFVHLYKTEKDLFRGVPDEYLDLNSAKVVLPLPKRCPEGCGLFIMRFGKWNPNEMSTTQLRQLLLMFVMQALRDPMTQINGFKLAYDFERLPFKYFTYFTPRNLHLFYNSTVVCSPARYKELHVISDSYFAKLLWRLIKPMLSEKIKSRVRFHSSKKELYDHYPYFMMPTGNDGEIQEPSIKDWIRRANKDQQKFTLAGQPYFY